MKRRAVLCWALVAAACAHPAANETKTGGPAVAKLVAAKPSAAPAAAPAAAPQLAHPTTATEPQTIPTLKEGGARSAKSERGMVVSVESHATEAGVEILGAGGNAVDAAIAVAYALAVTHPSAGNIGGGGFMLIHRKGEPTVALDFRERAPASLTQAQFDTMIRRGAQGPEAVGVPGSVAGLNWAQQRYGRLPRQSVLAPAIRLAKFGHKLGEQQALALRWAWSTLKSDPEARRIFGKGNKPKQKGELLVQSDLSATLERIASEGDDGFYQGAVAQQIVKAMGKRGLVSLQDLREYHPAERVPLRFPYRGFEIEVMPPPSAGGVAIAEMLLMMQQRSAVPQPLDSVAALHQFIELARRAQSEKRFGVMDPDSAAYDDAGRRARWLHPQPVFAAMPAIDPTHKTPSSQISPLYSAALRELEHTTHFAVVDAEGTAVSCTTTLSAGYGAGFVVPGAGFVMNNSLAAFGTVGDSTPLAGRRTTSSMAPTLILERGEPVAVLGTPGGDTIPNTLVQVVVNLVDGQMTLEDAIDAPRIHQGFVPDEVQYEKLFPILPATRDALAKMGHVLRARRALGDANTIVLTHDPGHQIAWGYADPREGGLALGGP